MILEGDCLDVMRELEDCSVDLVVTDPPYGYSFMGRDWDKAVPGIEVWAECLRVLKPGGFAFVMSAPRSDVQMHMVANMTAAGFRMDFTPLYWTYATGFPKAKHIGRHLDKVAGAQREVIAECSTTGYPGDQEEGKWGTGESRGFILGGPVTEAAQRLEGAYAGFQPKPAVEVIIVAMKPLEQRSFVEQAVANGKGVTWLDECCIPTDENLNGGCYQDKDGLRGSGQCVRNHLPKNAFVQPPGRFAANLLVSDDALNDGTVTQSSRIDKPCAYSGDPGPFGNEGDRGPRGFDDAGSYSRYFSLDAWWAKFEESLPDNVRTILPFLPVPKPAKSEKDDGITWKDAFGQTMSAFEPVRMQDYDDRPDLGKVTTAYGAIKAQRYNHHPTIKPLKLMCYLVTLGSRPGEVVLDPFVGSGTTCMAAKMLERNSIGIERDPEYAAIARARFEATPEPQPTLF